MELERRRWVLDLVDWRKEQLTGACPWRTGGVEQHWDHIRTIEGRLDVV